MTKKNSHYQNKVLLLIVLGFIIRIIIASFTELGNDEVYYWTYSQHLQWNYFDHPPMVAIWIKIFTADLSLQQHELFVRLGSLVSCASSTWILYLLGKKIHSEKTGWFLACLYNTSLYASIIAGVFIMPDSPQMLFWCSSLYLVAMIFENERSWKLWILFGISAGLCIFSKVHGIFLWTGLAIFVLFKKRSWLAFPQMYISMIITSVIISPIIFWNISNHFITYLYHSDRVTVHAFQINWSSFSTEFFGEIFYNNPANAALIFVSLFSIKKFKLQNKSILSLYTFIAVPFIIILLSVSLFRSTLPHWSGPAYVALLPLSAVYLAEKKFPFFPKILRTGYAIILFVAVAGLIVINFYPGTFGKKENDVLGQNDFTLDMYGWREAGKTFDSIYTADVKNNVMPANAPIVCYKWFPAAHEQYYFCHPLQIQMVGLGELFDLHEYVWYNNDIENTLNMEKAYCIVPSNENYDVYTTYKNYYNTISLECKITSERNNKTARYFSVYQLSGWKGKIPDLRSVVMQ